MILTDEYSFSSAVETAAPMGVGAVGIKMDDEGLLPSAMDTILSEWDAKARGAPKPRLLYTVPTGQNPTGATQGAERRKELYAVCSKHDVYILEDEPYYFLQMQPYAGAGVPAPPPPASHAEFLTSLVPSLLSLDVDGRVMRLDSFSKVIAPGLRTGWITASEQIIERFTRHMEVSVQNPSGISQIILFKMLDETWGHSGYLDWLINLRMEYTHRRDIMLNACERFLPRQVVTWTPPAAGMFVSHTSFAFTTILETNNYTQHWMTIHCATHPSVKGNNPKTLLEIEDEIFQAGIDHGVLTSRGSWFRAEGTKALDRHISPARDTVSGMKDGAEDDRIYFRATFAAASSSEIEQAICRFGEALRKSFEI
jgi:aromatic amino acid aminotransferase I / 2-aminoadipate transaminase